MSSSSAVTWVNFFTNAGIENRTAATYAHIFVENRIRTDMISELNSTNLKEMGINPMGDIISILRHSKTVTEQSVREKILSTEFTLSSKAVAKIRPASPILVSSTLSSVAIAPPRRVLPEHEGKYKVSLPKGSTKKSREILAKHSALQMDKIEKKSIFDRLNSSDDVEMSDSRSSSLTRITKVSPSIFKRLGSYHEVERTVENKSTGFSGILKNSPITQLPQGVVKHKVNPRVIINRPPMKAQTMDTYESEDSEEKMDSDDYKQVSFSSEVEVLEIEPRRQQVTLNANNLNRLKNQRLDGIKFRIGDAKMQRKVDPTTRNLHNVKRTVPMKPNKISPARNSKMRADQAPPSIKSRLDFQTHGKFKRTSKNGNNSSTVFNRLGQKKA